MLTITNQITHKVVHSNSIGTFICVKFSQFPNSPLSKHVSLHIITGLVSLHNCKGAVVALTLYKWYKEVPMPSQDNSDKYIFSETNPLSPDHHFLTPLLVRFHTPSYCRYYYLLYFTNSYTWIFLKEYGTVFSFNVKIIKITILHFP